MAARTKVVLGEQALAGVAPGPGCRRAAPSQQPALAHGLAHVAQDLIRAQGGPECALQAWLTRTVPAMAFLVALILLAGWLLNRLIRRLLRHRQATAN